MRRWWLLLVFAAALALWLWQASPRQESNGPGTATARQSAPPGYVAIGADLLDTGADGQPQFRLRAARIEQAAPNSEVHNAEVFLRFPASRRSGLPPCH